MINSSTSVDLAFYVKSGEWDLLATEQRRNVVVYTCCIEPYPDVTYYIHIRRKSLYYFFNIFLPCSLMSALTLLIFLLPVESGEKCGLGVTIMLSFAVFMLSVIKTLPDTSESFPLISIYLTAVLSMTAVSICFSVMVLSISRQGGMAVQLPRWITHILKFLSPLCCIHSGTSSKRKSPDPSATSSDIPTKKFLAEMAKELAFLHDSMSYKKPVSAEIHRALVVGINRIADRHNQESECEQSVAEWRCLAQLIDRSLFWILFIGITTFSTYLLVFYVPDTVKKSRMNPYLGH